MIEEATGFEKEQLVLALIPFVILIYFDFYLLGFCLFFFTLCLWEDHEDLSPYDIDPSIPSFEDPDIAIDKFWVDQRLKEITKIYIKEQKENIFFINFIENRIKNKNWVFDNLWIREEIFFFNMLKKKKKSICEKKKNKNSAYF
jgi:hypothetical protein